MAPELRTIDAHAAGWWGNLFKIDSDTSKLTSVDASYNEWRGYIDNEGREYLLPEDFTDPSTSQLTTLNLKNIYESFNNNLELRADDINNMPKLTYLSLTQSYIRGVFPNISTNSQNQNTTIRLDIESCRFRNLNSIGSSNTNRVNLILAYNQGTGVGGALLPSFSSPLNTQLQYINFNNSLSSTYPSNWGVIEDRNKLIVPLASENSTESNTPNVTWSSRNNNNTASVASQKLYASNSAFNIFSEVMVGDLVSGTGIPSQTRVTQIDPNGFIYVNNVVNITNVSLTFRRFGQDISSYFSNHANLGSIYASNCRITGEIPRFINTTNLVNIVLSNNLLSSYVSGTLENITGVNINRRTRPSLRNFILNNNPLSINSIRNIISEAHDIAVYFSQYNITPLITINLLQTKLDSANKGFINYSSNEIINDVISPKYEQLGPGKLYPGINISIF
jgi:hypothetical protein